jgi:hypothetical protein
MEAIIFILRVLPFDDRPNRPKLKPNSHRFRDKHLMLGRITQTSQESRSDWPGWSVRGYVREPAARNNGSAAKSSLFDHLIGAQPN